MTSPIVQVRDLTKTFRIKSRSKGHELQLRAVDEVSFDIFKGETLGLVGESGSGKSTTGRMLIGSIPATNGSVALFGKVITGPDGKANLETVRRRVQFVFQDPMGSLNPRMTIGDSIAEPIDIAGGFSRKDRSDRIAELLETTGLPRSSATRYPHEFSGGQRQRIVIARSLALQPEFVVCDEPVSALDVSMQAQIVNLLRDLQDRFGLSYLFVAHDLAVVRSISHRVAVLYSGGIVEIATRADLYSNPQHPYTRALLAAVPRMGVKRERPKSLAGEVSTIPADVNGCHFAPRCPFVMEICRQMRPQLQNSGGTHHVACHLMSASAAML
jgi:oligopeptide/dipeptide ABC transporter ATP-binding protein